ncbi:hypothetical protein T484DRAFT_1780433, partial [Baffinella frigidus]
EKERKATQKETVASTLSEEEDESKDVTPPNPGPPANRAAHEKTAKPKDKKCNPAPCFLRVLAHEKTAKNRVTHEKTAKPKEKKSRRTTDAPSAPSGEFPSPEAGPSSPMRDFTEKGMAPTSNGSNGSEPHDDRWQAMMHGAGSLLSMLQDGSDGEEEDMDEEIEAFRMKLETAAPRPKISMNPEALQSLRNLNLNLNPRDW